MTSNVKGILMMAIAIMFFAMLDGQAKFVMLSLPAPVAVFFRYFVALLVSVALLVRAGGPSLLLTQHPALQVLRGVLLLTSTGLNFIAISHLQLAQVAAILFTIPLWVCALSVPLLGERVGIRRWSAVLIGFLGVLVVMRPGTSDFHWAMLCSFASSLCGAVYNIVTRKVGARDRAETSLFYVGLVGAAVAALPLNWYWQMPQGIQWIPLIGMGLCGGIGHLLLTQAHRLAPASLLAPFTYTQIIWMIIIGYVAFGNVPDHWTLIGASVVVASGLFVFARERTLGRASTTPAPPD
ncbi:MAG TPA: DMT family transporter [Aestuariivirga sp.]|nr:DMT family transporter [Aestuariivirga sp.]